MRPAPLAFLASAALALVLASCGGGGGGGGGPTGEPPPPPPPPTEQELDLAQEVLVLVNLERTDRGLDPLIEDGDASFSAYAHAFDMDDRNFFDHVNPSGESPADRLERAGVDWSFVGENIALGYPTPEDVVEGWMGSEGHRNNILNPAFTHTGVGAHTGAGGPWWVQVFFTPP
jgi:uncharacterized protein YkwD